MTMPIRHRLALVCAALVSALIVGLGTVVYLRLEADLLRAVDDELRTRATAIIDEGGGPDLDISTTDVGDIIAQRVGRDGRIVASTPGLPPEALLPPAELAALEGVEVREGVVATTAEPVPVRLLAMPADGDTIVITGVTIDDQRAALATLLSQFAVALPVAIVLGAGWDGWSPAPRSGLSNASGSRPRRSRAPNRSGGCRSPPRAMN